MVSYPLPEDWSLKTIVLFIFLRHALQDTRYKFPHSNTHNRRKNNTAHFGIICIIYRINYMQILYLKEGRNFYALIRVKTDLNPFNMSIFSEYRTIMMCCERLFYFRAGKHHVFYEYSLNGCKLSQSRTRHAPRIILASVWCGAWFSQPKHVSVPPTLDNDVLSKALHGHRRSPANDALRACLLCASLSLRRLAFLQRRRLLTRQPARLRAS